MHDATEQSYIRWIAHLGERELILTRYRNGMVSNMEFVDRSTILAKVRRLAVVSWISILDAFPDDRKSSCISAGRPGVLVATASLGKGVEASVEAGPNSRALSVILVLNVKGV